MTFGLLREAAAASVGMVGIPEMVSHHVATALLYWTCTSLAGVVAIEADPAPRIACSLRGLIVPAITLRSERETQTLSVALVGGAGSNRGLSINQQG